MGYAICDICDIDGAMGLGRLGTWDLHMTRPDPVLVLLLVIVLVLRCAIAAKSLVGLLAH